MSYPERMITDITSDGEHQLDSCLDCVVPDALPEEESKRTDDLIEVMSAVQRIASYPEESDARLAELDEKGLFDLYRSAQQCLTCSRGMCIMAGGKNTQWRIGSFTIPE